MALPLYSLVWRAGRVGGRAGSGQPPTWSLSGLAGTLRFAASESWEPIRDSLVLAAVAATLTVALAWALAWVEPAIPAPGSAVALGTAGAHAGHARAGRRAWRWCSPTAAFPMVYDSPVDHRPGPVVRTLPYAAARSSGRRCGSCRRELLDAAAVDGLGPWGADLARRPAPLAPGARWRPGAWPSSSASASCRRPTCSSPPGVTTITFRIWSLLHTGVESHLAGVALVTLGVITLLVLLMILAAWLSKSPPTGDQTCAPWIQAKQGRGCPETLSVISSAKNR